MVHRVFERVQIDLIDMRHEPASSCKWICHMKDHYSKWCFLAALEDKMVSLDIILKKYVANISRRNLWHLL